MSHRHTVISTGVCCMYESPNLLIAISQLVVQIFCISFFYEFLNKFTFVNEELCLFLCQT